MYQVKIKIGGKGYKPATITGTFIPKGKSCTKEKIGKQCHEYVKQQIKEEQRDIFELQTISIKRINNDFIVCEDK